MLATGAARYPTLLATADASLKEHLEGLHPSGLHAATAPLNGLMFSLEHCFPGD